MRIVIMSGIKDDEYHSRQPWRDYLKERTRMLLYANGIDNVEVDTRQFGSCQAHLMELAKESLAEWETIVVLYDDVSYTKRLIDFILDPPWSVHGWCEIITPCPNAITKNRWSEGLGYIFKPSDTWEDELQEFCYKSQRWIDQFNGKYDPVINTGEYKNEYDEFVNEVPLKYLMDTAHGCRTVLNPMHSWYWMDESDDVDDYEEWENWLDRNVR